MSAAWEFYLFVRLFCCYFLGGARCSVKKEQIQEYAKEKGMSLNAYINALIQADMGEHLTPGVVKNLEGDTDPVE